MPATTNILKPAAASKPGAARTPTGAADLFAALLAGGVTPEGGGDGAPADAVEVTGEMTAPEMGDDTTGGADAAQLLPLLDQQMLMQPQILPVPMHAPATGSDQPGSTEVAGTVKADAPIVAAPIKGAPVSRKLPTANTTEPTETNTEAPVANAPALGAAPSAPATEPAPARGENGPVSRRWTATPNKPVASADQPIGPGPVVASAIPITIGSNANAAGVSPATAPICNERLAEPKVSAIRTNATAGQTTSKPVRAEWKPAVVAKAADVAPVVEPSSTVPATVPAPAPQASDAPQLTGEPQSATASAEAPPAKGNDQAKPTATPLDVLISAAAIATPAQVAQIAPAINEPIAAPEPAAVSAEEAVAIEMTAHQPVRRAAPPRTGVSQPTAPLTGKPAPKLPTPVMRVIDPVKVDAADTDAVTAAPVQPSVAPAKLDTPIAAPVQSNVTAALSDKVLDLRKDTQWIDQLAQDIASTSGSDSIMRFRLAPEQLGALKVEITQSDQGARIHLHASSEAAQQVLADATPKLAAEARAQGVRIADTQVSLSSGADTQAQQQQDSARQRAQTAQPSAPLRAVRNTASTATTPASAQTSRRSDRYA